MATSYEQIWETYVGAWRDIAVHEKRSALEKAVAQSAEYRDPLTATTGHEALIGYMLEFHRQAPGAYFATTSFQAHHDRSLAKWNLIDGSGRIIGDGVSYAQYGADGKLVAMAGFFEVPKSGS